MPKSGQEWNPHFLQNQPLFQPFEHLASSLRGPLFPDFKALQNLGERERTRRAPHLSPLKFVSLERRPRRKRRETVALHHLYDGRITLSGEVPCFERSYHDLFNALAFAAFPRSKRLLHQRQFHALKHWVDDSALRLPGRRTREQDALTIFDEGGVVLAMNDHAYRSWLTTTEDSTYEPGAAGVTALLFGHALLEHLMEGHLAIRASAMNCVVPDGLTSEQLLDTVDELLARRLDDREQFLAPRADCVFELRRDGTYRFGPPRGAREQEEFPQSPQRRA